MFNCSVCGHVCRDNFNLKRHQKTHASFEVECCHCGMKFQDKTDLVRHITAYHQRSSSAVQPAGQQCPLCFSKFLYRDHVETHLSHDHQLTLQKNCLSFDNEDEFYEWKADEEASSTASFVNHRTIAKHSDVKKVYFRCSRSGRSKMKMENRKKRPSLHGSPKTGVYCPARIVMKISLDGKVDVDYCSTHLGHDLNVARLRLPKAYRNYLALKIKMNIPLREILNEEREKAKEASEGQPQRSMFLTMNDLYNIARGYKSKDVELDQNHLLCFENSDPESVPGEAIIPEILRPEEREENIRRVVQYFEQVLRRTAISEEHFANAWKVIATLGATNLTSGELGAVELDPQNELISPQKQFNKKPFSKKRRS